MTADKVAVSIIDTSSAPRDRDSVFETALSCDVLCLLYAMNDNTMFERLSTYWLPELRARRCNLPVVIVGTKADLMSLSDEDTRKFRAALDPLMAKFSLVETSLASSAKSLLNVKEAFYYAEKSVMHPTAPIYDTVKKTLTPKAALVLDRIFELCDFDGDGLLSDEELRTFQMKCFNFPLSTKELASVKQVVAHACAQERTRIQEMNAAQGTDHSTVVEGMVKGCMTPIGFRLLHTLFIFRGRIETTWTVFRCFGYDDNVDLIVEPSSEWLNASLWKRYDSDRSGSSLWCESSPAADAFILSRLMLLSGGESSLTAGAFARFVEPVPFSFFPTYQGETLASTVVLHQLRRLAAADVRTFWRVLAHMGYGSDLSDTIRFVGSRSERSFFEVAILGDNALVEALADSGSKSGMHFCTLSPGEKGEHQNPVDPENALTCGLIPVPVTTKANAQPQADAWMLTYQWGDIASWEAACAVCEALPPAIPRCFLALMGPETALTASTQIKSLEYVQSQGLAAPIEVSLAEMLSSSTTLKTMQMIVGDLCLRPALFQPHGLGGREGQLPNHGDANSTPLLVKLLVSGAGISGVAVLGILAWKLWRARQQQA
jgi:hypothetical protein